MRIMCVQVHHHQCMCIMCIMGLTNACRYVWVGKAPGWPDHTPTYIRLTAYYKGGSSFWHWCAVSAAVLTGRDAIILTSLIMQHTNENEEWCVCVVLQQGGLTLQARRAPENRACQGDRVTRKVKYTSLDSEQGAAICLYM